MHESNLRLKREIMLELFCVVRTHSSAEGSFIGRLVCPLKTSNSRRLPEHSPDGATTKGT